MISEKMQQALNEQITAELWSSNLYLSMSFYLKHKGYDGMAHWLKKQSEEENDHACQIADYIAKRGGIPKVDKIDIVPQGWGTIPELFEHIYKHECHVSSLIDKLVILAENEKDRATQTFLLDFVNEQIEEEATAMAISEKIQDATGATLLFMDMHLGKRE